MKSRNILCVLFVLIGFLCITPMTESKAIPPEHGDGLDGDKAGEEQRMDPNRSNYHFVCPRGYGGPCYIAVSI